MNNCNSLYGSLIVSVLYVPDYCSSLVWNAMAIVSYEQLQQFGWKCDSYLNTAAGLVWNAIAIVSYEQLQQFGWKCDSQCVLCTLILQQFSLKYNSYCVL